MMDVGNTTQQLTQILTTPEASGSVWNPLKGNIKDQASKLCQELLQANKLSLTLPKSLLQSYINRDLEAEKPIVVEQTFKDRYTYKKQGGLDIYAYVELEIVPMKINGIIIQERLPEIIEFSDDISKAKCWELIDSIPLILKAIVDYAKRHALLDCQITLTGFRFHIVDYRNYAYYICALQCLKKIFGVLNVE